MSAALINSLSKLLVPGIVGLGIVQSSIYDVPGGHRAIIFDRFSGVRDKPSDEGTHLLVPWLQKPILYDVRIKPRNISTTTGSKDMQMVSLTLRVMSRPDTRHLATIYRSLGLDYDERVLPSIGNEVLKATVAQFDAAELITQREVVSSRIREDLLKRAGEFNIVLEDVSITHMTFGKEFTQAVEQKQVAQQGKKSILHFIISAKNYPHQSAPILTTTEAERAKFIVERNVKPPSSVPKAKPKPRPSSPEPCPKPEKGWSNSVVSKRARILPTPWRMVETLRTFPVVATCYCKFLRSKNERTNERTKLQADLHEGVQQNKNIQLLFSSLCSHLLYQYFFLPDP
ncbi:BQ5605_C007g04424 [Microbotryum silenes-dioicae]|uniref:Prohibitin n=1 Tax=Microbotryum silenes-dioicae TaxID=796604 RepID=A0A2X0MB44_9BASI|nr:BQ5605_C007g04424 [Microbotryum silenes-dioicae]